MPLRRQPGTCDGSAVLRLARVRPCQEKETDMPTMLRARPAPLLDDGFDLKVIIVASDDSCGAGGDCDTSDGCSSTCPSACNSGA